MYFITGHWPVVNDSDLAQPVPRLSESEPFWAAASMPPGSPQARYAAGTREILESFFAGRAIRPEYLIVEGGAYAGTGAHSYQNQG
nr:hypothetical protein [Frigoribacterium sp. PvP032]